MTKSAPDFALPAGMLAGLVKKDRILHEESSLGIGWDAQDPQRAYFDRDSHCHTLRWKGVAAPLPAQLPFRLTDLAPCVRATQNPTG
jgi:hypothetical protein